MREGYFSGCMNLKYRTVVQKQGIRTLREILKKIKRGCWKSSQINPNRSRGCPRAEFLCFGDVFGGAGFCFFLERQTVCPKSGTSSEIPKVFFLSAQRNARCCRRGQERLKTSPVLGKSLDSKFEDVQLRLSYGRGSRSLACIPLGQGHKEESVE